MCFNKKPYYLLIEKDYYYNRIILYCHTKEHTKIIEINTFYNSEYRYRLLIIIIG